MTNRHWVIGWAVAAVVGGLTLSQATRGLQNQTPPTSNPPAQPPSQPATPPTLPPASPPATPPGLPPTASAGAPATPFKPVLKTHDLMQGQDLHFKTIGDLLRSKVPAGKIVVHASVLAELANVNTMLKDKDDYRAWAAQVRDLALRMAEEGKKRKYADMNELNSLLGKIETTCKACHDAYQ